MRNKINIKKYLVKEKKKKMKRIQILSYFYLDFPYQTNQNIFISFRPLNFSEPNPCKLESLPLTKYTPLNGKSELDLSY